MRIRSKLVALIAVPLLALGLAAGLGFAAQSRAIERAELAEETLAEAEAIHMTALAIGDERLDALGVDLGPRIQLREATDATFLTLDAALGDDREKARLIGIVQDTVREARSGEGAFTIEQLTEANAVLSTLDSDAAANYPDAVSRNSITANRTAIWALEARETAWIRYIDGQRGEAVEVTDVVEGFTTASNRFTTSARLTSENGSTAMDALLRTDSGTRLTEFQAIAIDDLQDGEYSVEPDPVLDAIADFRPEFVATIVNLDLDLRAIIDGELESANETRSLFTLLAAIGLVVLTGLIFVIYRSITNPLESLLERASSVANTELPTLVRTLQNDDGSAELPTAEPIPVHSDDEIGELVEAFNDVQSTAYLLATEQALGRRNIADMFVNLGRRNQQLLQRILVRLSELEQEEEDAEKLRELFELDNIVTRMRRNAESLLALAGAQTARQWSQPIDIENTVRAAFGEVEGYERIDVTTLSAVKVTGNVVADITHLLAELLENAIKFSEPQTSVEVTGRMSHDGYVITVADQGIGMSTKELLDNNSRISDPPPLDQVPTKFLGLYVVGRLAERHEITVELSNDPDGGIVARVLLPDELLVTEEQESANDGEATDALPVRGATTDDESIDDEDDDDERSPLDERHDLDAELAELTAAEGDDAEDAADEDEVQADGGLPTRNKATPEADADGSDDDTDAGDSDDDDRLPMRAKASKDKPATEETSDDEAAPAAMAYAAAPAVVAVDIEVDEPETAEATQDGEGTDTALPTRNRQTKPKGQGKKRASSKKGRGPSKPAAADKPAAASVASAESASTEADDGLPVRKKGRALDTVPESVVERPSIADRGPTDTSSEAASGFSSMMSSLSTGINRGLEESDKPEPKEGEDQ